MDLHNAAHKIRNTVESLDAGTCIAIHKKFRCDSVTARFTTCTVTVDGINSVFKIHIDIMDHVPQSAREMVREEIENNLLDNFVS